MRKTRFVYWYLPAMAWGSLLIVLTSLPKLTPPSFGFKMEDKFYHLAFYVIFGFLWARAVIHGRREKLQSGLLHTGLFASIFAGLDELHQLFIPGRQCDLGDALADILGIVIALCLFKIMFNRYLSEKNLNSVNRYF